MTFKLEQFQTIIGVGAASGLVYLNEKIYLIGDNSSYLFEYNLGLKTLKKHPLLNNASDIIIKKNKPDFESITFYKEKIHIFGSGSTIKRQTKVKFDLNTLKTKAKDISELYNKFKQKANFTDNDLNIEGMFFYNNNQYFINRGNNQKESNAIFIYNKKANTVAYQPFDLPIINKVMTSFTDAICFENKIYFLACAENTTDTYNDGAVFGSIFGVINIDNFKIEQTIKITNNQKFEGLTLFSNQANEMIFFVCEDNDTDELQSIIYKLTTYKNAEFKL